MNYNGQSNRGGNFQKVPGAPYVLRVGDPSPHASPETILPTPPTKKNTPNPKKKIPPPEKEQEVGILKLYRLWL